MIEIKTAVAFYDPQAELSAVHLLTYFDPQYNEPVVIVHGLTESEVHEAAALLAKSREVCEWTKHHWVVTNCKGIDFHSRFTFCPSCGRRVEVKE